MALVLPAQRWRVLSSSQRDGGMTLAWSTGGGHACVGVGAQSKACSTKKRGLRQRRRTPSSALVRVTIIITVTPLVPHTQRNWMQSSKTSTPRSPQGFRRSYQGFPDLRKLLRLVFVNRRSEVRFLSLAPALSNISPIHCYHFGTTPSRLEFFKPIHRSHYHASLKELLIHPVLFCDCLLPWQPLD